VQLRRILEEAFNKTFSALLFYENEDGEAMLEYLWQFREISHRNWIQECAQLGTISLQEKFIQFYLTIKSNPKSRRKKLVEIYQSKEMEQKDLERVKTAISEVLSQEIPQFSTFSEAMEFSMTRVSTLNRERGIKILLLKYSRD
jgi:hypothetical protein